MTTFVKKLEASITNNNIIREIDTHCFLKENIKSEKHKNFNKKRKMGSQEYKVIYE